MHPFTIVFMLFLCAYKVQGHGYLAVPGARNSMWRLGFDTVKNYDDVGLNCGGQANQWEAQGGKCGLCGDRFQDAQPRKHEAGGENAPVGRPISRCYNHADNTIDVTVRITAHHKGYIEFRLCVNNNMTSDPSPDCIENGRLLTVAGTEDTRYDITNDVREFYKYQLDLPKDVTCSQCILHWKYNAGNSHGCDNTGCGIGLGEQEQFINCADIAILPDCKAAEFSTVEPKTSGTTKTNAPWTTTQKPELTTTTIEPEVTTRVETTRCLAVGPWTGDAAMNDWCMVNCLHPEHPYCPESNCKCD